MTFTVDFTEPTPSSDNSRFYDVMTQHVLAAGADWGRHFDVPAGGATLDVVVNFVNDDPTPFRFTGGSTGSQRIAFQNGVSLIMPSAGYELATGIDSQPGPDLQINVNAARLEEGWFDPDPFLRIAEVPSGRVDTYSVVLHELGHAFGFTGFRDSEGNLNGTTQSTFDQFVSFDGRTRFFEGPQAMLVYGGPVPLTDQGGSHLGNALDSGFPGADLVGDLMNGVVFRRGFRYEISELDLAILADTGVPIRSSAIPEPSCAVVLAVAACSLLRRHRRPRYARFA